MARERDRQRMSLSAFSRAVADLAHGVRGTSRTALRNLEEGRVDSPGKEVVEAAAEVLGVEEAWLWTGEPPRFRREGQTALETHARNGGTGSMVERDPGVLPRYADEVAHRPATDHVGHATAWGPGVAGTIAEECALARASDAVRTRFWSILDVAADARATAVRGPDDLLRLARHVDAAVLGPLELLRPGQRPEGPWFESYALELLDRVEAAMEGGGATARGSRIGEHPGVRHAPSVPPSLRGNGFPTRRERDGLTWRLM